MYAAATALDAGTKKLDNIAQSLANLNTPGYHVACTMFETSDRYERRATGRVLLCRSRPGKTALDL